jgi:hypothetical protein
MQISKQSWLEFIPNHAEREVITEAFEHELDPGTLEGITLTVEFTLSASLERWVGSQAELHGTSKEDVIEQCIQVARYIAAIFPWAHTPNTHYVEAVLNVKRLLARISAAREKSEVLNQRQKVIISTIQYLHGFKVDPPSRDSNPAIEEDDFPRTYEYDEELASMYATLTIGARRYHPAMAGELVHYLYVGALARDQHPEQVLQHIISASENLDSNLPDLEVPTLRERLLLKVLQARKLALQVNKILSALETYMVDLDSFLKVVDRRLLADKKPIGAQV